MAARVGLPLPQQREKEAAAKAGTYGSASDNCPDDPSSDQTDADSDGQGGVCDGDDVAEAIEVLRDAGFEFETHLGPTRPT